MNSLPKPAMVLFDLDGTLVDSAPDLSHSVALAMAQLGRAVPSETAVQNWLGNGAERLIHRALTGQMEGQAEAPVYQQAYDSFMSLYERHNGEHSRVYPGVLEGLAFLTDLGCHLGCVTNKPMRFVEPLLRRMGLIDNFALLLGGDSLPRKKPDPLPLLHAAEHFKVRPTQSWFIGDSVTDIKAARAANFSVICVSYGYNHGQDIRSYQPDRVVDSLAELNASRFRFN